MNANLRLNLIAIFMAFTIIIVNMVASGGEAPVMAMSTGHQSMSAKMDCPMCDHMRLVDSHCKIECANLFDQTANVEFGLLKTVAMIFQIYVRKLEPFDVKPPTAPA